MTVNKKGPDLLRAIAYGEELSVPHRVTSKMLTIDIFLPSSYSGKRYFTDPYAMARPLRIEYPGAFYHVPPVI